MIDAEIIFVLARQKQSEMLLLVRPTQAKPHTNNGVKEIWKKATEFQLNL